MAQLGQPKNEDGKTELHQMTHFGPSVQDTVTWPSNRIIKRITINEKVKIMSMLRNSLMWLRNSVSTEHDDLFNDPAHVWNIDEPAVDAT